MIEKEIEQLNVEKDKIYRNTNGNKKDMDNRMRKCIALITILEKKIR